jgi:hypothetical protein
VLLNLQSFLGTLFLTNTTMKNHYKALLVCVLVSVIIPFTAHAQSQNESETESSEPNRLSIGLMGGVTTGHLDVGSAFQSGSNTNFEFKEQLNSTVGFNIRYTATDEIALQSNIFVGKFSLLSDYFDQDALSFDNNFFTTSLTTQLNLLRIFGADSGNFNLYGSFGGGLMFNDISIQTDNTQIASRGITPSDHPLSTFFSTFGGGIRFNLSYRLDSFAQYDFNSASRDIVDGNFIGELLALGGSAQTSNSWSTISVGMQYKFGNSPVDADWPTVELRPTTPATTPERDVFEQLEELLARQADFYKREIDDLTSRVDSLEIALQEERAKNEQQEERETTPEEDPYAAVLREMQSRIDSLEQALAEERQIQEPPRNEEQIAEQGPVELEAEEYEPQEMIQSVRLQPELIGSTNRPIPLPENLAFVPEKQLDSDDADVVTDIQTPDVDETIAEAEAEEVSIDKKEISFETLTEGINFVLPPFAPVQTPDSSEIVDIEDIFTTLDKSETNSEEVITENRDEEMDEPAPDVKLLADSLTIVESLEKLQSPREPADTLIKGTPDVTIEAPVPEEKRSDSITIVELDSDRKTPVAVDESDAEDKPATDDDMVSETDKPSESKSELNESELDTTVPDSLREDLVLSDLDEEEAVMPDEEMEEEQLPSDDSTEAPNWPLFAVIAVVGASLIALLAKLFSTGKGSDKA